MWKLRWTTREIWDLFQFRRSCRDFGQKAGVRWMTPTRQVEFQRYRERWPSIARSSQTTWQPIGPATVTSRPSKKKKKSYTKEWLYLFATSSSLYNKFDSFFLKKPSNFYHEKFSNPMILFQQILIFSYLVVTWLNEAQNCPIIRT